ncbi:hypothetical protein B0H14DRAFT_1356689 [Mycena olivaceomarginata]|nr:hypothetical protein B0H14DRAFT_1356689 [Mycena olivaceomarginata]
MWLLLTRLSRRGICPPTSSDRHVGTTQNPPHLSRRLSLEPSARAWSLPCPPTAAQHRPGRTLCSFRRACSSGLPGTSSRNRSNSLHNPPHHGDIPRTLRALAIGAGAAIPLYHWHMFLGNLFTTLPRWTGIAARVATQQAIFPPVFNTYFFFTQAVLTAPPPPRA